MIVLKIIIAVCATATAYLFGYLRAAEKALKDITDIQHSVERVIKTGNDFEKASDAVIDSCTNHIKRTRDYLVLCRDQGCDKDELNVAIQGSDDFLKLFEERKNGKEKVDASQ